MRAGIPRELICRAYREAGRIVVAAEFDIKIRSVAVVTIQNQPPGTRLMSLDKVLERAKAGDEVTDLVERYIMVRLAGPITEMVRAAYQWEAKQHVVCWRRWRKRWKWLFTRANDRDIDTAFAIALGWFDREAESDLDTRLDELWKDVESLIRRANIWAKIQTLAGELLRVDVMTGTQAIRLIESM